MGSCISVWHRDRTQPYASTLSCHSPHMSSKCPDTAVACVLPSTQDYDMYMYIHTHFINNIRTVMLYPILGSRPLPIKHCSKRMCTLYMHYVLFHIHVSGYLCAHRNGTHTLVHLYTCTFAWFVLHTLFFMYVYLMRI